METTYVCDRSGRRWWPAWRDEAERLASHRPRVRVKDQQLRQWYGTLDRLVRHKPTVEQELFLRLRNLFALNVDLVFYDLTSTYFEGNGPAGLAKHGHSRDGAKGKLRAPEKIGAAAARILARNHGYRYYDWTLTDGTFQFVEHPVNLAHEKALEGTYLIQTEEPHLSPVEAVTVYKELSEVERAFAELKDVIEMRPIYHHKADRVRSYTRPVGFPQNCPEGPDGCRMTARLDGLFSRWDSCHPH